MTYAKTANATSRRGYRVRELGPADIDGAVALYRAVMSDQFLASCGASFLRSYHRAWSASPWAIALVAESIDDATLVGMLLGSVRPSEHYRTMVDDAGIALAAALLRRAASRPLWGLRLAKTRARRYVRGLRRLARPSDGQRDGAAAPVDAARVGEVAHLLVAPDWRGRGVGRTLVGQATERAAAAGVQALTVVTPPGWDSEHFYTRLGWMNRGELISHSHERFVRYEFPLSATH